MRQLALASTTQLRNGGLNVSARSCAVTLATKLYRATPFQSSRSYAVACLQHADVCSGAGTPAAELPCRPRTKATAYLLAVAGSSPGVSCPRPHRGSRKMFTFGDQMVSPSAWPRLYSARASRPIA
jgi:hypothetical protein